MKNKQIVFGLYLMSCLLAIMVGCNVNKEDGKESQLALMKHTDPTPITLVSQKREKKVSVSDIEKHVEALDDIYDVAVIRGKEQILIAYKVKHMKRFQMKRIEKELNSMLEEDFPKEDFLVSSDYKVFLEAVRLNEKMKDPKYSKEKANKELERIIKLKKELT